MTFTRGTTEESVGAGISTLLPVFASVVLTHLCRESGFRF